MIPPRESHKPGPASEFWHLSAGVLVINLDHRPERWQRFLAEAAAHAPEQIFERLPAVRGVDLPGFGRRPWFRHKARDGVWAARAGCVLSHRRALETARDKGWASVLILEDDAVFTPAFRACAARLAEALNATPWDLCYLGFTSPIGPTRLLTELGHGHGLHEIHGAATTHAYLVRAGIYDALLAALPRPDGIWAWLAVNRAIDRWYARSLSPRWRVLAVSPSVVVQAESVSDITGKPTDYGMNALFSVSLPARGRNPGTYRLLGCLRYCRLRIAFVADCARGLAKRLAGF